MSKYEITGRVIAIGDTQSFNKGFTKREFVIETNEDKYPQTIKFEATKDDCDRLDSFEIGDEINVQFNIRGNEYNGKYYVNLQAWKFERIGDDRAERRVAPKASAPKDDTWIDDSSDSIPF